MVVLRVTVSACSSDRPALLWPLKRLSGDGLEASDVTVTKIDCPDGYTCHCQGPGCPRRLLLPPGPDDEPTMGPTAMEESDSAGRASLAVAAAAAIAYVV